MQHISHREILLTVEPVKCEAAEVSHICIIGDSILVSCQYLRDYSNKYSYVSGVHLSFMFVVNEWQEILFPHNLININIETPNHRTKEYLLQNNVTRNST
jgi:hypothetical protein